MSKPASAPAGSGRRVALIGPESDPTRQALAAFVAQLGLESASLGWDSLTDVDYALVALGAESPAPDFWLEMGFLLAVVGHTRMCFVTAGEGTALPARLDGVARQALDAGGLWKLLLAREMKQAGLDVDLNKAI